MIDFTKRIDISSYFAFCPICNKETQRLNEVNEDVNFIIDCFGCAYRIVVAFFDYSNQYRISSFIYKDFIVDLLVLNKDRPIIEVLHNHKVIISDLPEYSFTIQQLIEYINTGYFLKLKLLE